MYEYNSVKLYETETNVQTEDGAIKTTTDDCENFGMCHSFYLYL